MTNSTDIVEALREFALIDECEGGNPLVIATERAAADLIQSQQALIEEMRGSMRDMADIIERAYDSREMVDGAALRYWVQLFRFAIDRSKALSQKE